MSEEINTEDMRYELGREYAQKGTPLHEGASEEFVRGYTSYKGFGSNVTPAKFGKGGYIPKDWTCVCGHVNNARIRRRVAGVGEVCWQCGVARSLSDKANN